jgi:hypothetical protein
VSQNGAAPPGGSRPSNRFLPTAVAATPCDRLHQTSGGSSNAEFVTESAACHRRFFLKVADLRWDSNRPSANMSGRSRVEPPPPSFSTGGGRYTKQSDSSVPVLLMPGQIFCECHRLVMLLVVRAID